MAHHGLAARPMAVRPTLAVLVSAGSAPRPGAGSVVIEAPEARGLLRLRGCQQSIMLILNYFRQNRRSQPA